ncbi:VOC family protein [Pseudochryseolinea flava]|uniref:VOC domain-containing protein n=1 Tax=Pseudochryseolinea flava TaxID=2059302 RepID=A0A364XWY0_9BACT|nr:hypothetical protein [Pseudochryseolinea flava]RAV98703.1 hypothetical protein DQQ10_22055 [Pseudochryseolinea flava]
MSNADLELHFWLCHGSAIPQSSSIYIRVADIETHYEDHERFGIVHPKATLEDRPWGMKEFASVDPDGNLLKYGQSSSVPSYFRILLNISLAI